jgi:hypothetical protein
MGVAVDVDGILYIADSGNDAIRRIQLGGKVRAFVRTCVRTYICSVVLVLTVVVFLQAYYFSMSSSIIYLFLITISA